MFNRTMYDFRWALAREIDAINKYFFLETQHFLCKCTANVVFLFYYGFKLIEWKVYATFDVQIDFEVCTRI